MERLVDHPGRTVSEPLVLNRPLAEQRATCIASSFGLSDDVAVMREEPTWTFRELKTGHWPMVSTLERLVVRLDEVTCEHG